MTLEKLGRIVGIGCVMVSVVGGFLVHPAVGVGLALLAGIRLWILHREERRQAFEASLLPAQQTAMSTRAPQRTKVRRR